MSGVLPDTVKIPVSVYNKIMSETKHISRYTILFPALMMLVGLLCCEICSANVVINEIHYDPDIKTDPVEFIELYNAGSNSVDLSGWFLADGVMFTFPNGSACPPGNYIIIAQNPLAGIRIVSCLFC